MEGNLGVNKEWGAYNHISLFTCVKCLKNEKRTLKCGEL